eukprot:SAG11_NODE_200_length_12606_cov_51.874550_8_plen_288_part_00
MVKRQRDARGPSYPPYVVGEPGESHKVAVVPSSLHAFLLLELAESALSGTSDAVAGNYYPVNSLISLDDGADEMAVVVDTTVGGSSMADGSIELMVHRRCQHDDARGVQEPLNETMCGCNDIGAAPGSMGAHGHEGDGGCDCEGLTMRGSVYLVLDSLHNGAPSERTRALARSRERGNCHPPTALGRWRRATHAPRLTVARASLAAHATRRQLIETLNFPPTLAFAKQGGALTTPTMSAIAAQLPPNVKLMTVSSNYAEWNEGQMILRLAHMYQVRADGGASCARSA